MPGGPRYLNPTLPLFHVLMHWSLFNSNILSISQYIEDDYQVHHLHRLMSLMFGLDTVEPREQQVYIV